MLKKVVHSPYLNLFSGLVLLLTAGWETWHRLGEFSLAAHHGVLVFSIIQLLKVIPELLHGLQEVHESVEPCQE